MNINKLKLLISAVVCITNACNAYAISNKNVNAVSHEYCQQNRDVVKLPSPEILTTNNDSSSESLEIDISDDLNKSFYIPPSVDVLGQPIEDPKEHIVQKVQLSNPSWRQIELSNPSWQQIELLNPSWRQIELLNPIWRQIENEEYNLERNIKIDWRAGHTYNRTVSKIAQLRASLFQKQDK